MTFKKNKKTKVRLVAVPWLQDLFMTYNAASVYSYRCTKCLVNIKSPLVCCRVVWCQGNLLVAVYLPVCPILALTPGRQTSNVMMLGAFFFLKTLMFID